MYASRADTILKLWRVAHIGRHVRTEREEADESQRAVPQKAGESSTPEDPARLIAANEGR